MKKLHRIRTWLVLALCIGIGTVTAQRDRAYDPELTRILFVLDGSGSMNEDWGGSDKYQVSKRLLTHLIDSINLANPSIEFGLRVFGHQSPKSAQDCKDSKLEVPFGPGNNKKIISFLDEVKPQGYTPIAYSLFQAANDFPEDKRSTNAIVLITDGLENCEGDPCAVAAILHKKRISLRPFVIGLGIGDEGKDAFDCVGTYFDASDARGFQNALDVVVSQALKSTTVQVNLMGLSRDPTETNVGMTFYDAFTGKVMYNFVHAFNEKGEPDTLYLDPTGRYHLTVHTKYAVHKKDIELAAGRHNVIAVDCPQGSLQITVPQPGPKNLQTVVREANSPYTLYVQGVQEPEKYLVGKYDLEVLTIPRTYYQGVSIEEGKTTAIKIEAPGTLTVGVARPGIMSIYVERNGKLELVVERSKLMSSSTFKLQPGNYEVVYRPIPNKQAILTDTRTIKIIAGRIANVRF
jgi:Ca-activated chloride channel family protein